MFQTSSPLVVVATDQPQGEPVVGGLVTVNLVNMAGEGFVQSGGRVVRAERGTFWVKLVGLEVPAPYQIGDTLPLSREKIVDWE